MSDMPLPDIGAGASVELTGTLNLIGTPAASTGLWSIYAQLDPDNVVDDLHKNNNLVAAGRILGGLASQVIYLPIVRR